MATALGTVRWGFPCLVLRFVRALAVVCVCVCVCVCARAARVCVSAPQTFGSPALRMLRHVLSVARWGQDLGGRVPPLVLEYVPLADLTARQTGAEELRRALVQFGALFAGSEV